MKSAPLPLRLPRLGVRSCLSLLLLCGTVLLPPVTGQTMKGLKCQSKEGSEPCKPADAEYCCFREYGNKHPRAGCKDGGTGTCKDGCVDVKTGGGGIRCHCAKNDCNGEDENPWEKDEVYKNYRSGSSSTTGPSRNHAAVLSGLVIVVAALGSLPALLTAALA